MRIKKVQLSNFKRFTNLTIDHIPEAARLVLLIGSNGSGKSSLFDAFDWLRKGTTKQYPYGNEATESYYTKDASLPTDVTIGLHNGQLLIKQGNAPVNLPELADKFIGRSSIRIVPRIAHAAQPLAVAADSDSPPTYIENDTRFINDVFQYIQQINNALREPVFSGKQADTLQIFRNFIDPLNQSLLNIFGGDAGTTIQIAAFEDATPHAPAKLIFKKGASSINYDLLSHGEKQVIILLINFIVRRSYYKGAILFIDEMDCHLNTALQASLLHEIVQVWLPQDAQLWTASHALGFIEYAQHSPDAVIIDFDLYNFDSNIELVPAPKDNLEVYEIALPKATIASILKGYKLVVVENKNSEYFNAALGQEGYLFLPANNNREVFLTVKGDTDKLGLRDRDYLRTDEIERIQQQLPHLKVLALSTFENFLYHPDNLASLKLTNFDKVAYMQDIIQQKEARLIDIVAEIAMARSHYIEFKDCIKNDGNIKSITDALQSNEFDVFYPFFNMKKHYNKKYLQSFSYTTRALAGTDWFKTAILAALQ